MVRFSPRERVQQRTIEQVEGAPWSLEKKVEAVTFTACEQVKQRTADQVVHEPQHRQKTAEVVRVIPSFTSTTASHRAYGG